MPTINHLVIMERSAWRECGDLCAEMGIDINALDSRQVIAAVRVWGERLFMLRRQQADGLKLSSEVISDAFQIL